MSYRANGMVIGVFDTYLSPQILIARRMNSPTAVCASLLNNILRLESKIPTMDPTILTTEITTLETSVWRALSTSPYSPAAALTLLSPSCAMLFPGGLCLSASSEPSLQTVLSDPGFTPWKRFALSEVVVVPLGREGSGAAFVRYKVEAAREGSEFKAFCGSCWEVREEGWRMASHQQTPI